MGFEALVDGADVGVEGGVFAEDLPAVVDGAGFGVFFVASDVLAQVGAGGEFSVAVLPGAAVVADAGVDGFDVVFEVVVAEVGFRAGGMRAGEGAGARVGVEVLVEARLAVEEFGAAVEGAGESLHVAGITG